MECALQYPVGDAVISKVPVIHTSLRNLVQIRELITVAMTYKQDWEWCQFLSLRLFWPRGDLTTIGTEVSTKLPLRISTLYSRPDSNYSCR